MGEQQSAKCRVYLDNAATSWPKPESVYQAIDHYQRQVGAAAGRGSYRAAEEVERTIRQTRVNVAKLINAKSASNIIFTFNCTDSLNLALHGALNEGDHVVTTVAEHNSILRPLTDLRKRGIVATYVDVDDSGIVNLDELRSAVTSTTKMIAVTHASNVTGAVQPISEIGQIAREAKCLFLLDAAQTLGHIPVDVSDAVDLLAAPGHKGLLGPLGTGILYVSPDVEYQLRSVRQGGTGTQSEQAEQPTALPAKFESGNLNVPGIIGLNAGVRHVQEAQLWQSPLLSYLTGRLIAGLDRISGVELFSAANDCGIVSFNISGLDPRETAALLDSAASVEVRAGLHCAPWMHQSLGTLEVGGTVRASFGHFNTTDQADQLIELVTSIAASADS